MKGFNGKAHYFKALYFNKTMSLINLLYKIEILYSLRNQDHLLMIDGVPILKAVINGLEIEKVLNLLRDKNRRRNKRFRQLLREETLWSNQNHAFQTLLIKMIIIEL